MSEVKIYNVWKAERIKKIKKKKTEKERESKK